MKLIARGAEAELYLDNEKIVKKRVPKKYRIKELDDSIRKSRTRREAKVIEKLPVPGPKLNSVDDKDMVIEMSFIDGPKVRDVLEDNLELCREIGHNVAILHNNGIIHEDLTTSNMVYYDKKVYFIDFGLSYFSDKVEDKAVDLHLLKQALESKHHTVFEKAFELVLRGYKEKSDDYEKIMKRFEKVESRGRNKKK